MAPLVGRRPQIRHAVNRTTYVNTTSRGGIENPSAQRLAEINGYSAIFSLRPDDITDPINLSAYLTLEGIALTET